MTPEQFDPTGLIREAYRIEGITDAECRSIFVDWALKLPGHIAPQEAIAKLIENYADGQDGHPMTAVLRAGMAPVGQPKRRGGRRARVN